MAMGRRIKELREAIGWTQERLAQEAEVGQATISAIETRDSSRSIYAARLAAAMGVTVELLMSDTPIPELLKARAKAQKTGAALTPFQRQVLADMEELLEEDQQRFASELKAAADQARKYKAMVTTRRRPAKVGHE